jgi:NAD+ synthase
LRQLSGCLGVPQEILNKQPTGDLWEGQTDEGELGFSYLDVDRLLVLMVDGHWSAEELVHAGFDPAFVARIVKLVRGSHYKRRLPVIAKLSNRTMDRDFRYARDLGT